MQLLARLPEGTRFSRSSPAPRRAPPDSNSDANTLPPPPKRPMQRARRAAAAKQSLKDATTTEAESSSEQETVSPDLTEADSNTSDAASERGFLRPTKPVKTNSGRVVKPKPSRTNLSVPSSPRKSSHTLFPMSSQQQLAAQLDKAEVETVEQRTKGWALGKMDQLVWVAIKKADGKFWWPADIVSENRTEVPLRVQLLLDPGQLILDFAAKDLALAEPSPLTILSFRGVRSAVRFDQDTFREGEMESDDSPDNDLFLTIKRAAEVIEDEHENQTLKSDQSKARDGNKNGAKGKKANRSRQGKARARAPKSPSPETMSSSASSVLAATESEDERLMEDDPSTKYEFPSVVLALTKKTYWPVTLTGYDPEERKFVVEWDSGEVQALPEAAILTKTNRQFFSVKIGDVVFSLNPKTLRKFVADRHELLQSILRDSYAPAASWNANFFAGGSRRAELYNKLKVGDLEEQHTEALGEAIRAFSAPRVSDVHPANPVGPSPNR